MIFDPSFPNPLFDLPERNMEMFCNFIFIYSVGADIIPHIPEKLCFLTSGT